MSTRLRCDERGIALQTAIIMVALIAVAVAISAVILSRGGEVADGLQRQNVHVDLSRLDQPLCEKYGYEWADDKCKDS